MSGKNFKLSTQREEFLIAVEELEDATGSLAQGGAPDIWIARAKRHEAARRRLLQLWDEREKELAGLRQQFYELQQSASGEVIELRAEIKRLRDDPECDATDLAHPAWWRGNDAGVYATVEVIRRVLDSGLDGGVSGYKPLQEIRERIERLRDSVLTEEEARIIDVHHTARCGYDEWDEAECHCTPEAKSARAKIRRLSGSPREERSELERLKKRGEA